MLINLEQSKSKLQKKRDKSQDMKKREKIETHIKWAERKANNIVIDLHSKVIAHFVENFDLVLFPVFNAADLVERQHGLSIYLIIISYYVSFQHLFFSVYRKITPTVANAMVRLRHVQFYKKLKRKCHFQDKLKLT